LQVTSGYVQVREKNSIIEQFSSFTDYLKARPILEQWCNHSIRHPNQCHLLIQSICQGSLVIDSDGSYMLDHTTAGIIIFGTKNARVENCVIAPRGKQDMSSYRGELMGVYSSVLLILCICEYFGIQKGRVTLGCDGLSALQRTFDISYSAKVDEPCYDLLVATHKLLSQSTIQWDTRHIDSHQDEHKRWEDIDFGGRLNIEADALVKSHIPVARLAPRHYAIADEPWSIWFHVRKIAKIEEEIYDIVHAPRARNYWENKDKTLNHNIDYIHVSHW